MSILSDQESSDPAQKPESENRAPASEGVRSRRLAKRLLYGMLFLAAIAGGFLGKHRLAKAFHAILPAANAGREVLYWTSPMDHSFRSDKPGKDAMGMDLVPVYAGRQNAAAPKVIDPVLTERDYATVPVEKGPLVRTIHTIGTIDYVEPLVGDVTLKIDGWLEKLYVDYEGQPVHRGDPMFDLYSPDLVATQQDFLISSQALQKAKQTNDAAVLATAQQNVGTARQRLRFWDVSERQIDELARTGKTRKTITFYSPFEGIAIEKNAFAGKYMKAGQLLYRIADLTKVWVYVFVYQNQIHCTFEGQKATLHPANLPGHDFQGKVIYIYPYLDPKNRAAKVRLEFENPNLVLKPGMYAGISLEPHRMGVGIKIPQTAILQTGERSLVYLAEPGNKFRARQITTGMELDGGMMHVLAGLEDGQRIVAAPSFLMDSESRLRSVNRRFGPAPDWMKPMPGNGNPGMEMPGMEMPGMEPQMNESTPSKEHEKTMPGMGHEQPAPEHEHPKPGTKGERQ